MVNGLDSPLSCHARRLRESRSKSVLNIESFESLSTPAGMQEFLKQKLPMPHFSQLNGGKFELLSVDDDPINQVWEFEVLHYPKEVVVLICLAARWFWRGCFIRSDMF